MIHQYKNNGYNIVLDVNSGSVHVVDELVYDVIALLDEGRTEAEIGAALDGRYPQEEISAASTSTTRSRTGLRPRRPGAGSRGPG